mmetsp:Transcript_820/g.1279  ORF Transcript_820/g.1279 Transcript_820/m.1279 type:complete len:797 (+) Transcript_820:29-2419(+)
MTKTSLPPAAESKFNSCLKFWEQKKYSKAESSINSLLTKFPESGECLCVKGLIQHSLGKKKEGYETAKRGIEIQPENSIGWKIMGLLSVDEKKFEVACDAFKKASAHDPENMTILKDLALVQIHLKDYKSLLETRKRLYKINNKYLKWWITLSVAYYLNKDYVQALLFLKQYIAQFKAQQPGHEQAVKLGRSQLFMYKYRIMKTAGMWSALLEAIPEDKEHVLDDIGVLEYKGEAQLATNQLDDAKKTYSVLLSLNPDCQEYLSAWQQACGLPGKTTENPDLTNEQREKLLKVYSDLKIVFPKSLLVQRILLNHVKDEETFKNEFGLFAKAYLQKSIPSLFSTMKKIYANESKVAYIEDVMLQYKTSLEENGTFPGEDTPQPPSTLVWCLNYLAFHYDARGDTKKALETIDAAIDHTPTIVELHLARGRICKHAGALTMAAESMDQARRLDLADRYLNTKSAKFYFRNDDLEKGYEIAEIFAVQNPEGVFNLHGFQCQWYAMERGDAFFRTGALAAAIEEYAYLMNHYVDFYKDFYDFHDFCFRSLTINSYINMIEYFETNKSHAWYVHSSEMYTKIWLRVHATKANDTPLPDHIVKILEEEKANPVKKKRNFSDDEAYLPHGDVIMREKNPLDEASFYVSELEKYANSSPETHALAIQVYTLRNEFKKATASWIQLRSLSPFHPYVLFGVHLITSSNEHASSFFLETTKLSSDLDSFYSSFFKDAGSSLSIEALVYFQSFSGFDVSSFSSMTFQKNLQQFRNAHTFLIQSNDVPSSFLDAFNNQCSSYFPFASCF